MKFALKRVVMWIINMNISIAMLYFVYMVSKKLTPSLIFVKINIHSSTFHNEKHIGTIGFDAGA